LADFAYTLRVQGSASTSGADPTTGLADIGHRAIVESRVLLEMKKGGVSCW
jgi:hypothetical protein